MLKEKKNSSLTDNIRGKENADCRGARACTRNRPFVPPTAQEVRQYCKMKNYGNVNAEDFVNFYESKGWMVGKNKMQKWHSAVALWNSRNGSDIHCRHPDADDNVHFTGEMNRSVYEHELENWK